jgi:hypothetical protein
MASCLPKAEGVQARDRNASAQHNVVQDSTGCCHGVQLHAARLLYDAALLLPSARQQQQINTNSRWSLLSIVCKATGGAHVSNLAAHARHVGLLTAHVHSRVQTATRLSTA